MGAITGPIGLRKSAWPDPAYATKDVTFLSHLPSGSNVTKRGPFVPGQEKRSEKRDSHLLSRVTARYSPDTWVPTR